MDQETQKQMIMRAMEEAKNGTDAIQPSIIFTRDIDHTKIAEYTSCYVNEAWAPKIKELIEGGWIVFRIQTEFTPQYGHSTRAYLAKVRPN